MPQWLLIVTMIGALLPMIQQVIEFIEGISVGQPGAFKKEQALLYIKAVLQSTVMWTKLDAASIDALLVVSGTLIDMVVSIFNATGKFPQKAATA